MNTDEPSKMVRVLGTISVAIVFAVAAVVSYAHMQAVAEHAGESWRSYLEPLSVDGLLIGASLVLYVRRTAWFAWLAVASGLLVSLAANLAAAEPNLISRLVSAWPAVAMALSYETLLTLVRRPAATSTTTETAPMTEQEPVEPTPEPLQNQIHEQDQASEPVQEPEPAQGWILADTSSWAQFSQPSLATGSGQ